MLEYFDDLGLNVCKLSFEGFYVARMLCFEKISFEKFILLEDVGLMTFVILWKVLSLGDFDFMKLVYFFLVSIFKTNKIHKHKF